MTTQEPRDDEIAAMRAVIDDLVSSEDCWFDHHGYCQAHMWFETDPACPHERAKRLLAAAAVALEKEQP